MSQDLYIATRKRLDAQKEFVTICAEARKSPVEIEQFVQNRIKYMQACEDVYTEMWKQVANTGVQVIR